MTAFLVLPAISFALGFLAMLETYSAGNGEREPGPVYHMLDWLLTNCED